MLAIKLSEAQQETFTTPSLDFSSHYKLLNDLVEQMEILFHQPGHQDLVQKTYTVLEQFNKLTKPPQKIGRAPLKAKSFSGQELDLDSVSVHEFDPTLSNEQKAKYHYLRGRLLNLFDSYHPAAEHNLGRAVKFNPSMVDAWKQLCECYCKKNDLKMATSCIEWALMFNREQESLVLYAQAIRQRGTREALEKSIQLCKEALAMDIEYYKAWRGIGISYLKLYFSATRDTQDLLKALAAYDKAEGEPHPDLYQNRAILHQYREHYEQSISDYIKTSELDPAMAPVCQTIITKIRSFMERMHSTILEAVIVFM